MKAAVMYPNGGLPQYTDLPEPVVKNDNEILVRVKAVAIKHFDKGQASGKHYASNAPTEMGRVVGGDGVFLLEDGSRVYGMGQNGTLAEKAIVHKSRMVFIPDSLDNATAAALPNAVFGAAMGLKFKANIQPGDVVLVNGATGFTGHVAVQIAKHYGAGKVIATGRNSEALNKLRDIGADETVQLNEDDDAFTAKLTALHKQQPIDIIIDYLWGHPAEMILKVIKGDGSFGNKIRYVSVGSMAGDIAQISSAVLRSLDMQLCGSGLGSWTKDQVAQVFSDILPNIFQLAADRKLEVKTITVPLPNITNIWDVDVPGGQRLVVTV